MDISRQGILLKFHTPGAPLYSNVIKGTMTKPVTHPHGIRKTKVAALLHPDLCGPRIYPSAADYAHSHRPLLTVSHGSSYTGQIRGGSSCYGNDTTLLTAGNQAKNHRTDWGGKFHSKGFRGRLSTRDTTLKPTVTHDSKFDIPKKTYLILTEALARPEAPAWGAAKWRDLWQLQDI